MANQFKDLSMDDIIAYCQANNQLEWLKTIANKQITHKIYPKVQHISKTGKKTMVQDKTQPAIGSEKRPITFVELKKAFIDTFHADSKAPKKEKKASFIDKINAL